MLTRFLCWIGFHRWSKWEDKMLTAFVTLGGKRTGESYDVRGQSRVCLDCNITNYRA